MKKSLILGILGIVAATVSSYGQGAIFLDNYISSTYNPIYLGPLDPGGQFLAPVGFTVGLYYDLTPNQNITGSIAADSTGSADPSTLNSALIQATGPGATASIFTPGYFSAHSSFLIQPGAATPAQNSYTIMVVAYNGSSYDSSTIRGHSAAVYIQDASPTVAGGADIGNFFPANTPMMGFIPEPTTMALGGLGLAALLIARRKKA